MTLNRKTTLARYYIGQAARRLGMVSVKRGFLPHDLAEKYKRDMDEADAAIEAEIQRWNGRKEG